MRAGGLGRMEALAMLPEGPRAVKDLFEWPRRALQKLLAAPGVDQKTRALKDLGQRKVLLYSYYSGKGSEATIAEHLDAVFSEAGIVENGGKFFHVMHAAELDNFCQTILLRAATQRGLLFKHVFADIGDRFLPEHLAHMKQMMPKPQPGAGIEAKREMYKSMDKYLEDIKQEGEEIFSVVKGQPAS